MKPVMLIKMCLNKTYSEVRVGKHLFGIQLRYRLQTRRQQHMRLVGTKDKQGEKLQTKHNNGFAYGKGEPL
jgi:hypothetical protein